MTNIDLVTILGNLSQSLGSVQQLVAGFAYVLGIIFIIHALEKLKKRADSGHSGHSESMTTPIFYLAFGAMLIYLPSAIGTLANTAFGSNNVLTYSPPKRADIYSSIGMIVRTGGLLWFVRGCVLVAHSSEPGEKHGPKGLLFIVAGIFAMNFDSTIAGIDWAMQHFISYTLTLKASQGY